MISRPENAYPSSQSVEPLSGDLFNQAAAEELLVQNTARQRKIAHTIAIEQKYLHRPVSPVMSRIGVTGTHVEFG
jgi:hypothetical protein